MTIKKIQMRPKGTGDYADILHPETEGSMVLMSDGRTADAVYADYVRNPGTAVTSGTLSAYTVALAPALTAYATGVGITIIPHVNCGASPTLNINGLGAVALLKNDGTAYGADELKANTPYTFKHNGTSFFADSSTEGVQ